MRAAIYSRFSTERQNEKSIDDQVRVCAEFAARAGWSVVEHYSDAGISGAAQGNRPSFVRMRADAMARRFDVILVVDTTRLARSQELAPLIDRFRFQGLQVIGVQDGFDSSDGTADMQAGLSGIMSVEFRRMIKARTHAALETRAKNRKPTGGRAYGYRDGKVDKGEAFIVREIFGRFGSGESCRTIAADLNARRILSPGASWARVTRRTSGWMGSGIRVILRNERYAGRVHWNQSEWRKNPDTGRRKRVARPRTEWITHTDEALRLVSDELFDRAQQRMIGKHKVQTGGRPKYLLSGLLRCDTCRGHYIIADALSYGCSGHVNGRTCTNGVRISRKKVEAALLDPIRQELLAPERIARIAKELQAAYAARVGAMQTKVADQPRELLEADARIAKLKGMQQTSPEMADELQAAVDRAESKRREILEQQPQARQSARLLAMLPKAAEVYRRQIAKGLEGDERNALKARMILRELFGGEIRLVPEQNGGLVAHWQLHTASLLRATGTNGSGGAICTVPVIHGSARLK